MDQNNDVAKKGHTYIQWTAALLANCVTMSFGFENGWISPVTKYLQSDVSPSGVPLSDSALALVASIMSMTAALGVPIFAYISDVYVLVVARAITGLAAGGVFIVIPLYVKEISQDNIRGSLGTLLVLMQNTGTFLMYVFGTYLEFYTVMYIALAFPVIVGLLLYKAPPSPLFLVKQQKFQEAAEAIALLRGLDNDDKIVQNEVECMKNEEARFQALPDISIKAIVKEKSWRRGFVLIMTTMTFHATNGAFVLVTYASAILISTGVKFDISPELQTLSLPFVMIIASLLLTIIVERCGRKILLAGAFFLSFLSMTTLGVAVLLQHMGSSVPSWLPVLSMMVDVAMYAGGVSPIPYIVMTEMFSYHIRAKVMGGVVTYAWFMSFVSLAIFTPVTIYFGEHAIFFVYGVSNLCGMIFVSLFLPETKGKNDDEIRKLLCGKKKCVRPESS